MITRSLPRWAARVALVVLVSAAVMSGSLTDAIASDYTYDRKAAVKYAKKYSCNGANCRNSAYTSLDTRDCTNFVSQALFAGGLPKRYSGSISWYDYSAAWINVTQFGLFTVGVASRGRYVKLKMDAAYTPAKKGDIYMYDWGKGNGYSHVSIATGWGRFGSYYDAGAGKNYNQITKGRGDKMAQHSTDRDGAPWNWGYQTERNAKVRAKMRTVLISMDSSGSY